MLSILLASSSPYRRTLLSKLGLEFEWASPSIDETPLKHESSNALVTRLSLAKANALASSHPNTLIIGSDQVAILENQILGKPHNHKKASAQLRACSNQKVTFKTGLCLLNTQTQKKQIAVESFQVYFRDLTDEQINNYLLLEQPYDCAGSFKVEGLGISLFSKLHGDDPNSLIGLPLIRLVEMLSNEGIDPLSPKQ